MSFDIAKFFDLSRLFHLRPSTGIGTIYFLLIFFGLIVLAGLIVLVVQKVRVREKYEIKVLSRYVSLLITMGAVGLLWTGFRYEKIFVLSARFWSVVWIIGFGVWFYFILKYQLRVVPMARKQAEERKMFNKYLPKKK